MPEAVVVFTGIVVFARMLDVGLRHRPGALRALGRDPSLLARSLLSALVVVPLAALALVAALPIPPEAALGFVVLAAAPGAPLTTRRAEAAGADVGYVSALQLTLAGLAVIHAPLVVAAFGLGVDATGPTVEPERIAVQVATVTFLPAALGWLIADRAPGAIRRRAELLSRVSRLLFVAFLAAAPLSLVFVPDLRATLAIGWAGAAAVTLLAAAALASGHLLGGPGAARRSGLAIATVARNLGLALYLAETSPALAPAIPTILAFALIAMLLALPCSRRMRRRAEA